MSTRRRGTNEPFIRSRCSRSIITMSAPSSLSRMSRGTSTPMRSMPCDGWRPGLDGLGHRRDFLVPSEARLGERKLPVLARVRPTLHGVVFAI